MTPLVKYCARRLSTSTAKRLSPAVVSRSLTFSDSPRRTVPKLPGTLLLSGGALRFLRQ
jgi:hypothetical protein